MTNLCLRVHLRDFTPPLARLSGPSLARSGLLLSHPWNRSRNRSKMLVVRRVSCGGDTRRVAGKTAAAAAAVAAAGGFPHRWQGRRRLGTAAVRPAAATAVSSGCFLSGAHTISRGEVHWARRNWWHGGGIATPLSLPPAVPGGRELGKRFISSG